MHPEDIKAEIRKRFGTVKAFEAAKGLGADSVRDVLRGRAARRAAEAISEVVGTPLTTLFPGRFPSVGEDNPRKRDSHRLNPGQV
ncbi:MAG TPA: helix-turn-helix domain-containing protein [Caulobacteraceae bacterium]|jgi:lambda repressor-like predicted transcriptional regulator